MGLISRVSSRTYRFTMRLTRSSSRDKKPNQAVEPLAASEGTRRNTRSAKKVESETPREQPTQAELPKSTLKNIPQTTDTATNDDEMPVQETPKTVDSSMPKTPDSLQHRTVTQLSHLRSTGGSQVRPSTGKSSKSRRRRSRMSLEQIFHVADMDKRTPETSTIVEADENSSYQKTTPEASPKEESLLKTQLNKEKEFKKRLKHAQRLYRERGHWKQIIKDVVKLKDGDFLSKYVPDGILQLPDLEHCYAEAEANIQSFVTECLTSKYGFEVTTLQNRVEFLEQKARHEAYDHDLERQILGTEANLRNQKLHSYQDLIPIEI